MSKNPVFGYLFGKKKPARLGAGVGVKKWSDCGLKSVVYFIADIFLLGTIKEPTYFVLILHFAYHHLLVIYCKLDDFEYIRHPYRIHLHIYNLHLRQSVCNYHI